MDRMYDLLSKEQKRMQNILDITSKRLINSPQGKLRLSVSQNKVRLFHIDSDSMKGGTYIRKENIKLAEQLAQKEYDIKVKKLAEKRVRQLGQILEDYQDNEIEQLFFKNHPIRQQMILPVESVWSVRVKRWKETPYSGKSFEEGLPVIMTENNERVRSKSEKIIADFFYHKGIPYKYECPLFIKGFGDVYPDFTLLSEKTGHEIYLEHFGRMDDPEYAGKAVKKIETYERAGIFPGEQLLMTFETSRTVLNMNLLENFIDRYL